MSDAERFPDLFNGVRDEVLDALPYESRALHARIEEFAGVPVDFRTVSRLKQLGVTVADEDAAYCDEHRGHVIVDDTGDGINAAAVTHELLHIQRYWIEQAPMLEAVHDKGANVELTTWLDNALEHLIIVPRESGYGIDPTPYWASVMNQLFAQGSKATSPQVRINGYLVGWTMSSYCKDTQSRKAALAELQRHGLARQARLLLERLLKARRSKARMVRIAYDTLQRPLPEARLVMLDIRTQSRVETLRLE